jgi:hypothetical protein
LRITEPAYLCVGASESLLRLGTRFELQEIGRRLHLRVLVVDDSAYVRKVVKEMVTCDLIMPGIDGVEFIRRQMAIAPAGI